MKKLEQHDPSLPGRYEAEDMFDEYQKHYSDIAELTRTYPKLAKTLGIFAIMRGYNELELPQVIIESIDIMKEIIEHQHAQETATQGS